MGSLTDAHVELLKKKSFVHIATVMKDGSPHASPVWVDHADGHVLVNSAEGRLKDRNIQRDPRVSLSVTDPDNPYRHMTIRGHVVERTTEGADAHIDAMARKYLGQERYPYRKPGEVRVLYRIAPDRIAFRG